MNRKEKTMVIAIGVALIEVVLKFWLASLSGSLGMLAGAYHSLMAIVVSVIVLLGLFVSRLEKKKLSRHINLTENVLSVIISLFIFYAAYEIFMEALSGESRELSYIFLTAAGALIGSIFMYFIARYKIYVGEETGSPALTADGYHNKAHMYAGIAILFGLLGAAVGLSTLDRFVALFIVALVFSTGLEILTGAVRALRSGSRMELKHKRFTGIEKQFKKLRLGMIVFILLAYILSGFYTVNVDERGMVKRFGKVVRLNISPGLHYRLPFPFEKADRVRVDRIMKTSTGKNMFLTGDENLLDANLSVHYRVSDAYTYKYRITGHENLVVNTARSSLRQVISENGVDFILTTGRQNIIKTITTDIVRILGEQKTGIEIVNVDLTLIRPPAGVISAFYDVSSAREDKVTYVNEANGYAEKIFAGSQGEARRKVLEAESYGVRKMNYAGGEAAGFLTRLREYQKSRRITGIRLYLETMDKILPGIDKYIIGEGIKPGETDLWFIDEKIKNPFTTLK